MGRLCLGCLGMSFFDGVEVGCEGKGEETREGVREMVMEWQDMRLGVREGERMLSSSSSSASAISMGRDRRGGLINGFLGDTSGWGMGTSETDDAAAALSGISGSLDIELDASLAFGHFGRLVVLFRSG